MTYMGGCSYFIFWLGYTPWLPDKFLQWPNMYDQWLVSQWGIPVKSWFITTTNYRYIHNDTYLLYVHVRTIINIYSEIYSYQSSYVSPKRTLLFRGAHLVDLVPIPFVAPLSELFKDSWRFSHGEELHACSARKTCREKKGQDGSVMICLKAG